MVGDQIATGLPRMVMVKLSPCSTARGRRDRWALAPKAPMLASMTVLHFAVACKAKAVLVSRLVRTVV